MILECSLLFVGFCFRAAHVSLSPRRQERYLVGLFGEVMKKIMFSEDGHRSDLPISEYACSISTTLSTKGKSIIHETFSMYVLFR